jgi:hypothetical protein
VLQDRVRQLAQQFRLAHAPLTPQRLAAGIGMNLVLAPLPPGQDGVLDLERQQVLIAQDQNARRQRFTLAHEVMHYLIYHDDEALSLLHELYQGAQLEAQLEVLCNLGASELLLPTEVLQEALRKWGMRARLIQRLAEQHQVSEEAAAVALSEYHRQELLILICGGQPLQVWFASKTSLFVPRPTRGDEIPAQHPLVEAQRTNLPFRGRAPLPAGGSLYPLDIWVIGGRVYAVYQPIPAK